MSTPAELDLIGVGQCVNLLLIRSMDDSLRFYGDGPGFTRKQQWIHNGRLEWCWLELGGSAFLMKQRAFVGNRAWVTSLKDPDGYQLHFQSPTDAPEESEYED